MKRLWLAAILALGVAEAGAAEWPEPRASYEAVRTVTMDGEEVMRATVHHDRGLERQEVESAEGTDVVIVRPDRNATYLLVENGLALEMSFDQAGGNLDTYLRDMNPQEVGTETVDGRETTKYRLQGSTPLGIDFDGHAWTTEDGIIVRMAGTQESDGERQEVDMRLEDVVEGPQDPALFELPEKTMTMDEYVRRMSQQ